MDPRGRVAIVTGAAVDIGQAIACRLAEQGARVVLADIAGCAETLRLIEDAGGEAFAMTADLRDDSRAEQLVAAARQRFGGVHILVNNAGGGQPVARYPDATPAQWSSVLQLNLRAPMLLTQLVAQRAGSAGGVVVNVASTAGFDQTPYAWPEYAAAKAALIRFTTALAGGLGGEAKVRVTCVVPDWVRTPRAEAELAAMTPEQRAAAPDPIPLPVLTDTVLTLVRDDNLSGHVIELRPTARRDHPAGPSVRQG
jgi:NAD(P)-dependent dehydrogenase (short-subunit alcohol dehydrogenase family)